MAAAVLVVVATKITITELYTNHIITQTTETIMDSDTVAETTSIDTAVDPIMAKVFSIVIIIEFCIRFLVSINLIYLNLNYFFQLA
jgi:hypothetical protein